jgi:tetratricopeptide (TPR) repeat protein
MGVLLLKRGEYAKALAHLERAVARAGHNHTRPREADAYYYRGLALAALGREADAEASLGRAAWDIRWRAAAYTRMAEVAARRRDWREVRRRAEEAVHAEGRNTRALAVLAVAHRQTGDHAAALAAAERALAADPLEAWAEVERAHALAALTRPVPVPIPRGEPTQTRLEVASDYAGLGLYQDVLATLEPRWRGAADGRRVNAMVYYVAADAAERLGRADEARTSPPAPARPRPITSSRSGSTTSQCCERAMARDPQDPRAPYYLGNLLMDIQPEPALAAWNLAARLDPSFAMVHRNLGWVAARREGGTTDAIAHYERAVAADPREPVLFYELDKLYEATNTPPADRLAALEPHRTTIALRDDATSRLVLLLVHRGRYDEALNILGSRRFHTWEGGTRFLVHNEYVDALLLRGHQRRRNGQHAAALEDYRAALEYPPNLGVGRPARGGRAAQVHYFIGEAYAAMGQDAKAREAWQQSTGRVRRGRPNSAADGW